MYICHIHDRIMTRLMTIFPAFTAVIMILCSFGVSGSLDSSFKSLDQYIATRDSYVSRKENSIEALKKRLVPSGHGRRLILDTITPDSRTGADVLQSQHDRKTVQW